MSGVAHRLLNRRGLMLGAFGLGLVACGPRSLAQTKPLPDDDRTWSFAMRVAVGAEMRARKQESYDPAYVKIAYPMGDVPDDRGVCTDTVIRAYRHAGVDLQEAVHKDMAANFGKYPRSWGLSKPDTNIDHRRVPNLMVFFSRKGETLAITPRAQDYAPGDLVTWDLGGGVPHIGMVVDRKSPAGGRFLIVHNIGQGPKMEGVLFKWKITGHYRYLGPR